MKVKVHYGQSLLDMAIQEYGDVSALFILAKDNNLEVDSELIPGSELLIREELPETADGDLVTYFKRNAIKVNQGELISAQEILVTNDDEPLDFN